MQKDFDVLREHIINRVSNKPIYFTPNSGNWGDALIRLGAIKFLRDIGIDYTEVRLSKGDILKPMMTGGLLLYGGGSRWTNIWSGSERIVKLLSKRLQVIVLPSTFQKHYNISNTTFFCRDSFQSQEFMPNATFCHDMAFYLGSVPFSGGNGTGYFFRTDRERSGKIDIPESNRDISKEGDHLSEGLTFFKEIGKYQVVHTDRLHVAIASCLLGRDTHLYPSSYFKSHAIYKSSIEPYFDNVTFHTD